MRGGSVNQFPLWKHGQWHLSSGDQWVGQGILSRVIEMLDLGDPTKHQQNYQFTILAEDDATTSNHDLNKFLNNKSFKYLSKHCILWHLQMLGRWDEWRTQRPSMWRPTQPNAIEQHNTTQHKLPWFYHWKTIFKSNQNKDK